MQVLVDYVESLGFPPNKYQLVGHWLDGRSSSGVGGAIGVGALCAGFVDTQVASLQFGRDVAPNRPAHKLHLHAYALATKRPRWHVTALSSRRDVCGS